MTKTTLMTTTAAALTAIFAANDGEAGQYALTVENFEAGYSVDIEVSDLDFGEAQISMLSFRCGPYRRIGSRSELGYFA